MSERSDYTVLPSLKFLYSVEQKISIKYVITFTETFEEQILCLIWERANLKIHMTIGSFGGDISGINLEQIQDWLLHL